MQLRRVACGWMVMAVALGAAGGAPRDARPPIVFAARVPGGGVPLGIGPLGRVAGHGGVLLRLRPDGGLDTLTRGFDASGPAPSPSLARLAWAARASGESRWRVRIRELATSAEHEVPAPAEVDDTDPAWLDDSTLVFVRGGDADSSLYRGLPAPQLFAWRLGRVRAMRLTNQRNGALDPAVDAARGRLLFARWWYNPWRPAPGAAPSRREAGATDDVNTWQVMSARPAWCGDSLVLLDLRLAAGGGEPREANMGLQPAALADGRIVATHGVTRLFGVGGPTGVHVFPRGIGPASRLAGAIVSASPDSGYGGPSRLAASAASSAAPLPDGSVLVSLDPGARGAVGLWRVRATGAGPEPVAELAGDDALDAAPWVPRRALRIGRVAGAAAATFRYENRDVFAGDGAPARMAGARLVVFREGERIAAAQVGARGQVSLDLPAGVPLFEMLVDASGAPLATGHGPALVRGFNTGSALEPARCRGCHLGHSRER